MKANELEEYLYVVQDCCDAIEAEEMSCEHSIWITDASEIIGSLAIDGFSMEYRSRFLKEISGALGRLEAWATQRSDIWSKEVIDHFIKPCFLIREKRYGRLGYHKEFTRHNSLMSNLQIAWVCSDRIEQNLYSRQKAFDRHANAIKYAADSTKHLLASNPSRFNFEIWEAIDRLANWAWQVEGGIRK